MGNGSWTIFFKQNEVLMIELDKMFTVMYRTFRNNIHPWSLQMCQMCQIPDIPIAESWVFSANQTNVRY